MSAAFYPSAKIIKHSITFDPQNLTYPRELFTISGNIHRFVLSEFNTHRAFSRNSASSRAIPTQKMIDLVCNSFVEPVSWGENRPGMSAENLISSDQIEAGRAIWYNAMSAAVAFASQLKDLNVHKQIVNRILEPFLPHTVVFTCDKIGLNHFLSLRCHPDAQPEIKAFAEELKTAVEKSIPENLSPGGIHLPFDDSKLSWKELLNKQFTGDKDEYMYSPPIYNSVSTCARYSYLGHEKNQSPESQEKLFWQLFKSRHLSPFEHPAIALSGNSKLAAEIRREIIGVKLAPRQNYSPSFLQLRKILERTP